MRRKTTASLLFILFLSGTVSAGTFADSPSNCNPGTKPQFTLARMTDSHIINFTSNGFDSSEDVICLGENFTVKIANPGNSGGLAPIFDVTNSVLGQNGYGSHVRVPASSSPAPDKKVFMNYTGSQTIDSVGINVCSPMNSSGNCRFLFSINNTSGKHGTHVGQKNSGKNVGIKLEKGLDVSIVGISQPFSNNYKINMTTSGTSSISDKLAKLHIDWNTSDTGVSPTGDTIRVMTPPVKSHRAEFNKTYPNTGSSYQVNISVTYETRLGKSKTVKRNLKLPDVVVEHQRTIEIDSAGGSDTAWFAASPKTPISFSKIQSCGPTTIYQASPTGLNITPVIPGNSGRIQAKPFLGLVNQNCQINIRSVAAKQDISFTGSSKWNATNLAGPMNYTEFYNGTNCGPTTVYSAKPDGSLGITPVIDRQDALSKDTRMPSTSLILTNNECTVTP